MSDYPKGGDVGATREWLDKEGFIGYFTGWKADALLAVDLSDILALLPSKEGLKLWSLLSTARNSSGNI